MRITETTLTILVTPRTRFRGEKGESLRFTDLRAGDTVFIASEPDPSGHPVASSIRRGPMTLEELRRRVEEPADQPPGRRTVDMNAFPGDPLHPHPRGRDRRRPARPGVRPALEEVGGA